MAEDFSSYGKPVEVADNDFSSFGKAVEGKSPSLKKEVEPETSMLSYAAQFVPGAVEAFAGGVGGMAVEAVSGLAGLSGIAIGKDFKSGYEGSKDFFAPLSKELEPTTAPGKDILGLLGKIPEAIHAGGEMVFEKTGSPLAAAATEGLGTLATFVAPKVVGKGYSAAKKAVVKDVPKGREVDPSFEASRIKPNESISEVLARKKEGAKIHQAAFRNKETGDIEPSGTKHDETKKVETEKTHDQGFVDTEGKFLDRKEALTRAKETGQLPKDFKLSQPEDGLHSGDLREAAKPKPLARTDKEGNIHIDEEAATKDFHNGFSYIFDGEGPTGAQKKAVFEQLGITRDQFKELVRTPEEYQTFLKAHEESHVSHGDHATYPRVEDGSPNLMHEDALAIEARATKEGLEAIKHTSTIEEGVEVVKTAQRNIRADIRNAEVFSTNLDKALKEIDPEGNLNHKLTRALEAEQKYDQLPKGHPAFGLLEQVQTRFKEIGERAKAAGLLDQLRDNYVTHVLDFSKSNLSKDSQQALLDKFLSAPKDSKLVKDFTAERKFEFLRELEKALEGTGVVVHTDIAKIISAYEKAMQTAMAYKGMVDHFERTVDAKGNPWIKPVSPEALKEKYVAFQGKGSRPFDGKLVHPDIVDVMKHVFEQNDPELILRALGGVSHLTKSLNTVGSLFHAYSLGTAHAMTDPIHFAKEVATGGRGIRRAVDNFKHGGAEDKLIDGFIRNGLVATTEDVQRTIVAEAGKATDKVISRFAPEGKEFKVLQHATDPLDKHVLQKLNTFTWDYMHTGQKLNLAMHLFAKAKAKNPHLEDAKLQQEISGYINNTFGGLDWLEVASQVENKFMQGLAMKASGLRGRAWGQVLLFAPDWTVSTLRAFTTALPKEMMKPQFKEGIKGIWNPQKQGDFARRYVFNTAIAYLTLLNGTNMMMSDHPIWENKDPTRIDLGDGTTMQAAKHSMEAAEWATDPEKTLGNKLGFWPKAATVTFAGVEYPSPNAPKIRDNTPTGRALKVLGLGLPFQASSAIQAPEGEAVKRATMSSLGLPIYGKTKEEIARARLAGKIEASKNPKKKKDN